MSPGGNSCTITCTGDCSQCNYSQHSDYINEATKYQPNEKYRLYGNIPIPERLLKGKSNLLPLKSKSIRKLLLNRRLMYCNRIDESLISLQVG